MNFKSDHLEILLCVSNKSNFINFILSICDHNMVKHMNFVRISKVIEELLFLGIRMSMNVSVLSH